MTIGKQKFRVRLFFLLAATLVLCGVLEERIRRVPIEADKGFQERPVLLKKSEPALLSEKKSGGLPAEVIVRRASEEETFPALPELTEENIEVAMPTREFLRQEMERNPHAHPAGWVQFSSHLARSLKVALASDSGAKKFFQVLKKCATSSSWEYTDSIRAVCLSHAGYLAAQRVVVRDSYFELFDGADEEVKRLL